MVSTDDVATFAEFAHPFIVAGAVGLAENDCTLPMLRAGTGVANFVDEAKIANHMVAEVTSAGGIAAITETNSAMVPDAGIGQARI